MKFDTKKLTMAAIFSALAFAISALCNVVPITLVPALPFLHYDAKDVLIVIGGFILGPVYALAVSLVTALIELAISSTGPIGMLMNFLSSAVFACTAALIYGRIKNIYGAILGLLSSVVLTTAFMLAWNFAITPLYMGISREAVTAMLIPAFLPFNLIKSGINAGITLIVYKPLITVLRRIGAVKKTDAKKATVASSLPAVIVGALAIAVCVAAKIYFDK